MGQGLRRASWSEGGGCGGAAGFSFGERPGSNGGSAGRWLLPFPGNGPGTGGVFLGRRGRAAAGRRASLSGRERVRTDALRGGGCCRSPETAREQAVCFLVEGDGLRRGDEPLFRGEAGSDTFPVATAIRCYRPLLATTRRLPPLAACHYPPPATSATVACHPCRCLPSRCCRLPPACHYPPPATSAADCVLTACVSTVCRFSPLVITTCRPPLPPAACLLPPSPACHHPLLPAPPAASHPPLPPAATARRNSCLPPPLLSAICHHPLPAISAAMRRPGGQMGCGGTPRGRSGRDASPARSSAK